MAKKFNSFTIISSSFTCDKNCPYCTAKTTKWPVGDDRFGKLPIRLEALMHDGVSFDFATLSGNGEPSMLPLTDLNFIMANLRFFTPMIPKIRVQTSGHAFFYHERMALFLGCEMEITRVYTDFERDSKVLGYKRDYTLTPAFNSSPIVLNLVLMKGVSPIADILWYLENWPNLVAINLIILNANTFDDSTDNPYTQWILNNSAREDAAQGIADTVSEHFIFHKGHDDFFDSIEWRASAGGIPILMFMRKAIYGLRNVVFYRGELVDYHLRPFSLQEER